MKFALTLAALSACVAAPALAQDAGATIMGNDDAAIGTVISNDGATVLVDTGTHEAPLPADLIANTDGVYSVNATKAQIDGMMAQRVAEATAEAEAAAAALEAALVVGADIVTQDAQPLGTVARIAGSDVVVSLPDAELVTLPRDVFALGEGGTLMAQIELQTVLDAINAG